MNKAFLSCLLIISAVAGVHLSAVDKAQVFAVKISAGNEDLATSPFNPTTFRLPNDTVPLHYDLRIRTEIQADYFLFTGTVRIDIRVLEDTDTITLHSNVLNIIQEVNVFNSDGSLLEGNATRAFLGSGFEFLTITLPSLLEVDQQVTVEISYISNLRTNFRGFFRRSYQVDGLTRWFATTNFLPFHAREAFPCYDEPRFKTTFQIQIDHHYSYNAVSNMPVARHQGIDEHYMSTIFEVTPPISTYLVAFTVSDFEFISNQETDPEMRVFARPDAIFDDQADNALEIGATMLRTMSSLFDIPFSLPKADQIALPETIASVENWGLISHPENIALRTNDDPEEQNRRELRIAHEFSVRAKSQHILNLSN